MGVRNCVGKGNPAVLAARGQTRLWRSARCFLTLLIGIQLSILPGVASAQIIADPRAPQGQQPQVIKAANGVPVINIQTPSAAGVSRNTYQQFDVSRQGVILNNAQKNASTQQGGWVQGNPNLQKGTARIILNEVNSTSPSQLRGYMEIAGSKAQLVVANPSGITCDGCGFINTHRATLTTGTPIFQNGDLTGYRVQGGRITIEGQGLDARGTDYTDIISRAVSINSGLWAEHLNVVTGTNQVSTDLSQITPIAADGNDPKPKFALDVAAIGGMHANSIYLIGTEAGLGVISAGHIGAAVGDVIVTIDGRLESKGSLNSTGNTQITARQGIQNQGTLYAQGNVSLNTSGDIINSSVIAAAGNTSLTAGTTLQGTSGSLIAAGLQADNTLAASGILTLNAGQNIDLQGTDIAGYIQRLTAAELQLAQSRLQGNTLYLTSRGNTNLQGTRINASGLLQTQVSGTLDTRNAQIAAAQLQLTAQSLNNQGGKLTQIGTGTGNIGLTDTLNNQGGYIASNGDLQLTAISVDNSGGSLISNGKISARTGQLTNTGGILTSVDQMVLDITGSLFNSSGLIRSGTLLQLTANTLDNHNTQGMDQGIEAQDISLAVGQIDNTRGSLLAQDNLTLGSRQLNNNSGLISSNRALTLAGSTGSTTSNLDLNNGSGTLLAGQSLSLSVASLLGNGRLVSQGDLTLDLLGNFTNVGQISAQRDLTLTIGGQLLNQGEFLAGNALFLHAAQLQNAGTGSILANFVTLQADNSLTNRGLIDSIITRITAQTLDNLGTGRIYGDRVGIQVDTLNQDAEGGFAPVIAARDRIDIGVGTLNNRENSLIFSGGNLYIGRTIDDSVVSGQADTITNASAAIEALGDVHISTGQLTNTDTHYSTVTFPTDTIQVTDYQTDNGVVDGSQVGWFTNLRTDKHGMYAAFGDKGNIVLANSPYGDPVYEKYLEPPRNVFNPSFNIPLYDKNDQVWALFGMPNPTESAPKTERPLDNELCQPKCAEAQAAWDTRMAPWTELQKRVDAARQEIVAESISYKTYREYTQTNQGAQVINAQPGKILSGGDMLLDVRQTLNNHMSHILAGGYLDLFGQNVTNESVSVSVLDDRVGKIWKWEEFKDCGLFGCDSYYDWKKYSYTDNEAHTLVLNLARTESHTATGTGTQLGGLQLNTATDAPALPQVVDNIATVRPNLKLPNNSLFKLNPNPQAHYLIETDPRFTQYKQWLSSDYMIQALGLDLGLSKRLGDGFYEQRLIREQIGQLTGRRFLDGYANDEAQYQALLENGVLYAQEHQLIPGVSLSAAQMAQLTSDIVWLVEQTITLADGTTTRALVPQVYMRVQEGDLAPGGAMIAGNQVYMNLEQDLTNRGLISGRELVDLNGRTLNNLGGHIQAATIWLTAQEDINNIGGRLQAANELIADAGRDIRMETTTASTETRTKRGLFQITNVDQVASVYVSAPGANLELNAGRDITLTGAQIQNDGGSILISAGRDLNLNTVAVAEHIDITRSKRNYIRFGQDAEVGTRITLGGAQAEPVAPSEPTLFSTFSSTPQLTLLAGNDIKARAATVDSAGALTLAAGQDVSIEAGMTDHYISTASYASGSSAFSSSSAESRSFRSSSRAQGSSFGGDTVSIQAGQDINLLGSHVIADKELAMGAGRDINITAATESTRQSDYRKEKNSGFFSTGGMGFTIGKQEQMTDGKGTATYAAASTVGSIEGSITLVAGRNYTQTGSDIVAPEGDIGIVADQILIQEARETSSYEQKTKFKQSGLTVSIGNPLITAAQTAEQMGNASGDSSDPRMTTLAAASTALAGYKAYQALSSAGSNPLDQIGGLSISVSFGSSKSESNSWQRGNTAAGSNLAAGGNLILLAHTENQDGNITIQGSNLSAGKNMSLVADRDINLLAARNTYEQHSKSSSSSKSIGVSYTLGGIFSVSASSNKSRGNADGNDLSWTNTHLLAGDTLTLISGNDLTLRGATAQGERLVANVGGNLTIESLQDTANYKSKERESGFSLSLPTSGASLADTLKKGSGSISYGKTDINSNYQSVTEQSALKAGDGGFIVDVRGDTTLIGGAILSTQEAIDRNNNYFNTGGELTLVDLKNKARYEGTSYAVNLGAVPSTDGNLTPDTSGAGFGRESGEASSTTYAAISGIAGKEEAHTGDKESGIQKIFDADEVERSLKAQVEITRSFGQQATKLIGEYALAQTEKALALRVEAEKTQDEALATQLRAEALEIENQWGQYGTLRIAAHTIIGGLTGDLSGAAGAAAGTLTAAKIGEELDKAGVDSTLNSALTILASAAAGAIAGGTDGAGTAFNEVTNNHLTLAGKFTYDQKKKEFENTCGSKAGTPECNKLKLEVDALYKKGLSIDKVEYSEGADDMRPPGTPEKTVHQPGDIVPCVISSTGRCVVTSTATNNGKEWMLAPTSASLPGLTAEEQNALYKSMGVGLYDGGCSPTTPAGIACTGVMLFGGINPFSGEEWTPGQKIMGALGLAITTTAIGVTTWNTARPGTAVVAVGEAQYVESAVIQTNTTIRLSQNIGLANGQIIPKGSIVTVSDDVMRVVLPDGTKVTASYSKVMNSPAALPAPSGWPNTGGSGPVPGTIGITDKTSVAALNNYYPKGRGVEFIYDPITNTFVTGRPASGLFTGSPHQQLAQSIGAADRPIVGGTLMRKADGTFITTENSGHFGSNWNDAIRQQFQTWLSGRTGMSVQHTNWKN
ncbi:hemagglutinin repeat-containing protein [Serratia fonticola]|uniref:hemagglutinin repeat-containing protein n=1 Tax=Serratia fonticola TaxID=47917 RepID=UPI00217C6CED|nr:hemagglutinin repeat-containing protein [Serratia fonticola]CAI1728408.1 Filamentous hemagglutinin [Serratia fonticola]